MTKDKKDKNVESTGAQAQNSASAELTRLKLELEKEHEGRLRAMADLENYRKHVTEERAKFGLLANMQLVSSILDILNDVQLAENDKKMNVERAREVIAILRTKLTNTLAVAGVQRIDVNVGDEFDPKIMEAVTITPVKEEREDGKVMNVISTGYRYTNSGQVFRTVKVVVGKILTV